MVARAVADTPHLLIAGEGATRFARTLGVPEFDPATPERKEQTAKILAKLRAREQTLGRDWRDFDWRARWNFETTLEALGLDDDEIGHDTVGVAVRGADGSFAVALSTGGTTIMLNGRIGDTPILGAGLYAGPDGAVAATGRGERIIEATISRRVHDWIAGGRSVADAVERGVDDIRGKGSIGLIAIGRDSMSASADRKMAWAARELGSSKWQGPDPRAP